MTALSQTEDDRIAELVNEKRRDYRNTVLFQVLLLVSILLLEDLLRLFAWPAPPTLLKLYFHLVSGIYVGLLWDMLRNFTSKVWLSRLVLVILVLSFANLFVLDIVLGSHDFESANLRLASHLGILFVEFVVISFAIRDLFRGPRHAADKLWGSACIYFMSGFAFGGLLYCVLLRDPLAFGREIPATYWGLFESVYVSMNALVGLDTAYPDSSRLVRNIALLEGAWSQLYMVLLIGRLLSQDEKSETRSTG